MSGIKTISHKVTSIEVRPKQNNFIVNKGLYIARQFKYLISLQTLFCINRLYLLKVRKIITWCGYIYATAVVVVLVYSICTPETGSASFQVFQNTNGVEYTLLVFFATWTNKKKLRFFYGKLANIDDMINISNSSIVKDSDYRSLCWLLGSILYNIIELVFIKIFLGDIHGKVLFYYMMSLTHDSEQIFFFSMVRIILIRLKIVKAHVLKLFSSDEKVLEMLKKDKIEVLSDNMQLDVSSLHKVYELLHQCSEQLNYIMSLPMLVMLFSSGLSSTMLLKILVSVIQATDIDPTRSTSTMIYLVARCLKYTLLVLVPCYYSSVITAQVARIRTTLHDALHTLPLDRIERRKVKAFFQMTKVNEFSYAICGVIDLNMSLPLSYMSLCTTYLVIIIQFSKFID